jgi:hypothetical protein
MNNIEWRVIPDFPMYKISEYGDIYSYYKSGKMLKPKLDKDGYLAVNLTENKVRHDLRVHRLVASAFLDNQNNLPIINHKDLNVSNNHYSNLEWCTYTHNTVHYYANGINKRTLSSLTKEEMLSIVSDYKDGASHKDLKEKYNLECRADAISEIVTGRRFSEITGIVKSDKFEQRTTAKHDDDLILELLIKAHCNNIPQKTLCEEYKLSAAQISRIVNGSRRREVFEKFMKEIYEKTKS